MTAILEEIRKLDAARERGEIGYSDFALKRKRLLESVEDAQFVGEEHTPDPEEDAPRQPPIPGVDLWLMALVLMGGFTVCTALVTWLVGDITLALTASVTLLAALCVRAFRNLQD
jgi:hypothetical protein